MIHMHSCTTVRDEWLVLRRSPSDGWRSSVSQDNTVNTELSVPGHEVPLGVEVLCVVAYVSRFNGHEPHHKSVELGGASGYTRQLSMSMFEGGAA